MAERFSSTALEPIPEISILSHSIFPTTVQPLQTHPVLSLMSAAVHQSQQYPNGAPAAPSQASATTPASSSSTSQPHPPTAGAPSSSSQAAPRPAVEPNEVGWLFVPQYYSLLNQDPNRLHRFYTKKSTLIHGTEQDDTKPVFGQQQIHEKMTSLGFSECKVFVSNVDSQASAAGGMIIQVLGELSNKDGPWRKFAQTFFLAEQPNGYYVLNDIFRYLKEDDEDAGEEEVQEVSAPALGNSAPATTAAATTTTESQDEPVAAPATLAAAPATEPAAPVEPVASTSESRPAPVEASSSNGPAAAAAAPAPTSAAGPSSEAAKPKAEATPTPAPAPAAAAPTPAPATASVTPAQAPAQTPAPAPAAPPAPKTWAGLAASGASKWASVAAGGSSAAAGGAGSARASGNNTPAASSNADANGSAAGPSSSSTAAGAAGGAGAAPGARAAATDANAAANAKIAASSNSPLVAAAMQQNHGHVFIKNVVAEHVSQELLRSTLESKFGKLKECQAVPSKACAFVEFESIHAARRAILMSLPTRDGGEGGVPVGDSGWTVTVEEKKPKGERPPTSGAKAGGGGGQGGSQQSQQSQQQQQQQGGGNGGRGQGGQGGGARGGRGGNRGAGGGGQGGGRARGQN